MLERCSKCLVAESDVYVSSTLSFKSVKKCTMIFLQIMHLSMYYPVWGGGSAGNLLGI